MNNLEQQASAGTKLLLNQEIDDLSGELEKLKLSILKANENFEKEVVSVDMQRVFMMKKRIMEFAQSQADKWNKAELFWLEKKSDFC